MADAFAVIHTWPELRNAEYEVVQRILGAAANVGRPVVVIDNNGTVVWASPTLKLKHGQLLPNGVARFVISLHFESPRVLDLYSFYAVWQPIEFYFDFGYTKSIDKFTSHNDLLSCDSDAADAHALNLFFGMDRAPLEPLPRMFHMVAQPYLEPCITEQSKLFYIGINWERIGRPKGRFHDVLVSLDKKGLTEIYGPEEMFGVAPWAGFDTYQGELPFDGRSVLRAINRAGICLALSSAQHKKTGIMSNRLFEGLAGGAAVIATPNALIDKHFRDVVYLVDDSRGEQVLGQMTLEALREIRSDTSEARRRVVRGQEILRDVCALENSIQALFATIDQRIAYYQGAQLSEAAVTAILIDDYGSPTRVRERICEYEAQTRSVVDLHILCDSTIERDLRGFSPAGAVRSITFHAIDFDPASDKFDGLRSLPQRTGPTVANILAGVSTPYFMVSGAEDILFSDHLPTLAKRLDSHPAAAAACSGVLRQVRGAPGESLRTLIELRLSKLEPIVHVNGDTYRARFMFRTSLARPDLANLLSLLDGQEHRCFQLGALISGELVQTGYASCVVDETMLTPPRRPAELIETQHQCIRDRFRSEPRWIDLVSRGSHPPEFVYAYAPGAPVPSVEFATPQGSRPLIELGRLHPTTRDGEGREFLRAGFSPPEDGHTWLSSKRGIIDFRLPAGSEVADHDIVLVVVGYSLRKGDRGQHCTFHLNGMSCAYLSAPDQVTELRIRIPLQLSMASRDFQLEIIPDFLDASSNLDDNRELGVALLAFGVMPHFGPELPVLRPNTMHDCGTGQTGAEALLDGFYPSEPNLTWMAGTRASIRFRVAPLVVRPLLRLRVWGLRSDEDEPQIATLSLNRKPLGRYELPDRHVTLELPLAATAFVGGHYVLEVGLHHAHASKDDNGTVIDGRLLGLALLEFGVFEDKTEEDAVLRLEVSSSA